MRRIFRLLGDVQELRFNPHSWRENLVSGLCTLINARQGMTIQFSHFTPEGIVGVDGLVFGGHPDMSEMGFWDQWGRKGVFREDPQIDFGSKYPKHMLTARREDIIPDKQWHSSPFYIECAAQSRVRGTITSFFRIPGTDDAFGLAMHREKSDGNFSIKEKQMVEMTMQELYLLFQENRLPDLIPAATSLTFRQSQVLHYMIQGDSEKQIAARMQLSKHTVHDHIKAIYKYYDVQSRGELFACFIRRQK